MKSGLGTEISQNSLYPLLMASQSWNGLQFRWNSRPGTPPKSFPQTVRLTCPHNFDGGDPVSSQNYLTEGSVGKSLVSAFYSNFASRHHKCTLYVLDCARCTVFRRLPETVCPLTVPDALLP